MAFKGIVIGLLALLPFCVDGKLKLSGVTVQSIPFIIQTDGKFSGFAIDIVDYIAKDVDFEYELRSVLDENYGKINLNEKKLTGVFGELQRMQADFALTDLVVNNERKQYADFTEPFMKFRMAALIHKNHTNNMMFIQDLFQLPANNKIKVAVARRSFVRKFIEDNNQTTTKLLRENLNLNTFGYFHSREEALKKVQEEPVMWIGESTLLEYFAAQNCDLKVLSDREDLLVGFYAIALQKNSPHLSKIDESLKKLIKSEQFDEMKKKYWKKPNCK